jgi:phospholipase/lecithinase/hemolysin
MVVTNIPDLSRTPEFAGYPVFLKEWIRIMVGTYNLLLEVELDNLADSYNCSIIVVDIESAMNHMIANKELYDLENVTDTLVANPALDPDTTLFWDDVHPTTAGHRLLADEVLDEILNTYVPGEAIGLDGIVPGWVHR